VLFIGLLTIDFLVPECSSLKQKRGIVKSLIDKMRNNFNASVSEIANDKWQRGQIGVSIVSNDSRFLDSQLRKIMNFVETVGTVEIIESNIETF
tara:strand:- start:98 stop:379 length:282 start_codon:yes stop_codon:yes gene_type:complete